VKRALVVLLMKSTLPVNTSKMLLITLVKLLKMLMVKSKRKVALLPTI
jgi:hypothetical protein